MVNQLLHFSIIRILLKQQLVSPSAMHLWTAALASQPQSPVIVRVDGLLLRTALARILSVSFPAPGSVQLSFHRSLLLHITQFQCSISSFAGLFWRVPTRCSLLKQCACCCSWRSHLFLLTFLVARLIPSWLICPNYPLFPFLQSLSLYVSKRLPRGIVFFRSFFLAFLVLHWQAPFLVFFSASLVFDFRMVSFALQCSFFPLPSSLLCSWCWLSLLRTGVFGYFLDSNFSVAWRCELYCLGSSCFSCPTSLFLPTSNVAEYASAMLIFDWL